MLREQIKKWFFEAVRLDVEAPQDLKEVILRGHPRLDGFLDRMCVEIEKADAVCRKKGVLLKQKTLQDFTYDMTKYFLKGFEGEAKRRHESDIARLAREAELAQQKEFDAVLSGNAVGEFAEAGVITNEKIDAEREK